MGNIYMDNPNYNTKDYWDNRYKSGGNSGAGSHEENSVKFKANYVNEIIKKYNIKSLCDYGCGDGNQLRGFNGFETYTGYDISSKAIEISKSIHKETNKFFTSDINEILSKKFDMIMALDVTYHLIEEYLYIQTLANLFSLSDMVCLYTIKMDGQGRNVIEYVEKTFTDFKLIDEKTFNGIVSFFLYQKM
jgi:2-polyprenyl-3-methyl-5-hydroxy-6-metoxy-1,4-benzoquinol methylase